MPSISPQSWSLFLMRRWRLFWARRHREAFTTALIGLAGKLAAADGQVTQVERDVFLNMLRINDHQMRSVERQFNLVSTSLSGADGYARWLARLTKGKRNRKLDILMGLSDIARADGVFDEAEQKFLMSAGALLGLSQDDVRWAIGLCQGQDGSCWVALGFEGPVSCKLVKERYRSLARAFHPDAVMSRGVPEGMRQKYAERFTLIAAAHREALNSCSNI